MHFDADSCWCFRQVVANDWAFAARRDDGEVVCWGDCASGGDVTPVAQRIAAGGRVHPGGLGTGPAQVGISCLESRVIKGLNMSEPRILLTSQSSE